MPRCFSQICCNDNSNRCNRARRPFTFHEISVVKVVEEDEDEEEEEADEEDEEFKSLEDDASAAVLAVEEAADAIFF